MNDTSPRPHHRLLTRVLSPEDVAKFKPKKLDHFPDASEVVSTSARPSPSPSPSPAVNASAAHSASPGHALAEYARLESKAPATASFSPAPDPAPSISLRVLPEIKSLEMQSSAAISALLAPVGAEIKLTIRW